MCNAETFMDSSFPETTDGYRAQDCVSVGEWKVWSFDEVGSTSDIARECPGWSAISAKRQMKGRGRTGRAWISDEGGLWLSAVIPTPGELSLWQILPLGVGWALMEVLRGLGVKDVRLRWPNDIMIGRRKLAGLLVERFHDDRVVLGIGMNVQNRPEKVDPALANIPTILAEHVIEIPQMNELIRAILVEIGKLQELIVAGDFVKICDDLNRSWGCREVELSLRGKSNKECVFFEGVNEKGDLLVRSENQREVSYTAAEVELLREMD